MSPTCKRFLIYAFIIAFAVFLALAFYIQLKGLVYEDTATAPPIYQAWQRTAGPGEGAAHAEV